MRLKRAQAAMEYLFVVGFGFMMLLPIIALFYSQSGSIEDEIILSQAEKALEEIRSAADQVYFLGVPSKQTLEVRFPDRVDDVTITNNRITMQVQSSTGARTTAKRTQANITGSVDSFSGIHVLTITATETGVHVEEQ